MLFPRIIISIFLASVLVNLGLLLLHSSPSGDHKSTQRSQLQAAEIPEARVGLGGLEEEAEGYLMEAALSGTTPANSPAASRAMASVYDEDDAAGKSSAGPDEGILVDDEDFSTDDKISLEIVEKMKSVVDSMNPEELSGQDLGQFEEDERVIAKKLRIQQRKLDQKEREQREQQQREREERELLFAPSSIVAPEDILQKDLKPWALSNRKECEPLEGTPRESCPTMHTCRDRFEHISFCFLDQFTDETDTTLSTVSLSENGKTRKFALGYKASEGHLFKAEQVFVDFKGAVFDRDAIYTHGGCKGQYKATVSKGQVILSYPEVINLGHIWSQQSFHLLTDVLASAFHIREFILSNPDIPILVKAGTNVDRLSQLLRLDHLPLKFVPLKDGKVVFAQKVYFTLSPQCGLASGAVWRELKKFLNEDQTLQLSAFSQRKIVVPERLLLANGKRAFDILEAKFGVGRVVQLQDSNQAEVLSAAPSIFVASLGTAAWNQVYLPEGSFVVEIIPKGVSNPFFGHLAVIFGFGYQPVVAQDNKFANERDLVLAVTKAIGADL